MAYYVLDPPGGPALGVRRPTINEFFLSSYTLPIYAGCEIGCTYCDGWAYSSRPLNETVRVPADLPQRVTGELEHVQRGDMVGITALSDPYQPAEQNYRITRQVLQSLADAGQPCFILTKSPMVLDDLSILKRINERSLAIVATTLLTVDPHLAERVEGKAALPGVRLEMLATLKRAGLPVGVAFMPIIPYVNDTDGAIATLLRACAEVGVDFVFWEFLHIPNERHRVRINEMLARVGSYPASYYRDIYGDRPLVSPAYRNERNVELLTRCDGLRLEPRVPHRIYADKLHPQNEAALLFKHAAFRDGVQGRNHLARIHRDLAEQSYRGALDRQLLQSSPIRLTVEEVLRHTSK